MSGTPFFSITTRASSSTLLLDLCESQRFGYFVIDLKRTKMIGIFATITKISKLYHFVKS